MITQDITIGATVARKSKGASTGRTGQVIEISGNRTRVHWTKKSKGDPMSSREWIATNELMVVSKPPISIDEAVYLAWKNEQEAKYEAWIKASDAGTMKDDENPAFMFSTIETKFLCMIVNGEISAQWMAGKILANRGLDKKGNWVGFDEAAKIHETK